MSSSEGGALPPGWDTKFDPRTGRYYFINHYTKTTSWEDPRVRYQQIGKSSSSSAVNKDKPSKGATASTSVSSHKKASTSSINTPISEPQNSSSSNIEQNYPIGTIPAPNNSSKSTSHHHIRQETSTRMKTPGSPLPISTTSSSIYNHGISSAGAGTGIQASPLPVQRLQLEESFNGSPIISPRASIRRESHVLADISENEALNTDEALQDIAAMFPTVDENHIRDLLKKYHNSKAVVISALQVAKHPFITPGPSTVFTPPPTRHSTLPGVSQASLANMTITGSLPHYYSSGNSQNFQHSTTTPAHSVCSSGYPTPRPGSAASGFDNSFSIGSPQIGQTAGTLFRSFPRPHSSPKMKLRYLKSVFPTVEEYLLLDVLGNSDNNVQKAADRLVKMGYVKRDTPSAPRLHARRKEEERLAEKRTPLPKPPPIKSDKEKDELRKKMRDKYEVKYDIPERILYMALESVLYDEDQANNLIISMIEDDIKRKKSKELEKAKDKEKLKKSPKPTRKIIESERQPKPTSPKHQPKKTTHGKKGWPLKARDQTSVIKSVSFDDEIDGTRGYLHSLANGPNTNLRKGPNDDLLLTNYVTWNGPDPDIRKGPNKTIAKGPLRQSMIKEFRPSLAKGPQLGLSKGPSCLTKRTFHSLIEEENFTNIEILRV